MSTFKTSFLQFTNVVIGETNRENWELHFWSRKVIKIAPFENFFFFFFFGLMPKTAIITCYTIFLLSEVRDSRSVLSCSIPILAVYRSFLSLLIPRSNGTEGTRNRIKVVIIIKYQHFLKCLCLGGKKKS